MALRRLVLAAALAGVAATAAPAQPMDPNDLAFWQSIQAAETPAEYEAYLRKFPNGLFAELARLRLAQLGTGAKAPPNAGITASPAPALAAGVAPAAGGVVGDATLSLEPSQPRVGQKITLTTEDMPEVDEHGMFVIVPAGTPDESIGQQPVTPDTIASSYTSIARNYTTEQAKWTFGPLPPGAYEARWMTTLYNLKGKYEVGARAAFQVGR